MLAVSISDVVVAVNDSNFSGNVASGVLCLHCYFRCDSHFHCCCFNISGAGGAIFVGFNESAVISNSAVSVWSSHFVNNTALRGTLCTHIYTHI